MIETYLRFAGALAAVLALILGLGWVARRRQGSGITSRDGRARRRLAVVETAAIDGRTRLALVRCDTHEYLLVVTPNGVTPVPTAHPVPPARLPETDAP